MVGDEWYTVDVEQEDLGRNPERRERELQFRIGQRTRPSARHPERNEDAILVDQEAGVFAVFDGVSGLENGAGGSAAQMAKEHIARLVREMPRQMSLVDVRDYLVLAAHHTNETLWKHQRERNLEGLETTMTLGCIVEEHGSRCLLTVHVGDSRAYVLRGRSTLETVTLDDSLIRSMGLDEAGMKQVQKRLSNAQTAAGLSPEERRAFRFRNLITQGLGYESIEPHTTATEIQPGDRVLLTTDGIHDNLIQDEMEGTLKSSADVQQSADNMVEAAAQRSAEKGDRANPDDMTTLVVEVVE